MSPATPLSAASTASSLSALADATVSLGSAAPLTDANDSEQLSVIERMQRQLEHEREAREAAESEKRRLEEHVQRLEQSSKQQQAAAGAPHTGIQLQSAPSTPPQHSFAAPAASAEAAALPSSSSPFPAPLSSSSSHLSPVAASVDVGAHAARGVLASDLGKLFPSASEDDSDERGVSCHQCKSNKPKHLLLFCTTKADSSGRKRRCRKKYCQPTSIQHSQVVVEAELALTASSTATLYVCAAWCCVEQATLVCVARTIRSSTTCRPRTSSAGGAPRA